MTDVEVTIHVPAAPADVFAYLTNPAHYVRWMGSEASLEPVPATIEERMLMLSRQAKAP